MTSKPASTRSKRGREDDDQGRIKQEQDVDSTDDVKQELKVEEAQVQHDIAELQKKKERATIALRKAINHGSSLSVVQFFIDEGASVVGEGQSLVSIAWKRGAKDVVSLLIQHGGTFDQSVWTSAIHQSKAAKTLQDLAFIVDRLPGHSSEILNSTLSVTFSNDDPRYISSFTEKVELSVLSVALLCNAPDNLLEMMIGKGADVNFIYRGRYKGRFETQDFPEMSPLHDLLYLPILFHRGNGFNEKGVDSEDLVRIIKLLRKHGVNVETTFDTHGENLKTVMDVALSKGYPVEVIKCLF